MEEDSRGNQTRFYKVLESPGSEKQHNLKQVEGRDKEILTKKRKDGENISKIYCSL